MNLATITFTAPIYSENSYTTTQLGEHQSTMTLRVNDQNWKRGSIEWDIPSLDCYTDIGLWFEDDEKTLADYDGVFALPTEAIKLLTDNGFIVGEQFIAD